MSGRDLPRADDGVAYPPRWASGQHSVKSFARTVEVNGVALATQSFGSKNDPAVLLIMGATASMLGWPDELCATLAARGFFVLRFDHRDTGRSTTMPPGQASYSVEDMAADVVGVMNAYGLERVALVGMSLGGYIAQMVALQEPDRVSSIVLVSSEPLGWDGPALPHISQDLLNHFGSLATLRWEDADDAIQFLFRIGELSAGTGHRLAEAQSRARIEEVLARTDSPASMFNHATLITREDWTGRFREITHPVLVIHGEEDPVLPVENGKAIAAGIRGAQLLILPGIGHELPGFSLSAIAGRIDEHVRSANSPSAMAAIGPKK